MFCQVPSVMVTTVTLRLIIPTPGFGLQTAISRHMCGGTAGCTAQSVT